MKKLTPDQKREIRMNVFRLPVEKRTKIFQMISWLQAGDESDNDDEIAYSVMLTYMDKSADKKLDKDFERVMNSPSALWDMAVEDGKGSKIPKKVVLKKDK